jgi:EAL domain-containing protein (putative c-di-GMP-specific phosphodiesterase class I)/CheY-like chemotaxis protein
MTASERSEPARLLICDDDPQIGRLIAQVASSMGYAVKEVNSIGELGAILDTWSPACVVLDLLMPEGDGIEGIKLLADRLTAVRLVLMSGIGARVLESARRTAQAYGLKDIAILPKPFRLDQVRALLAGAATDQDVRVPRSGSSETKRVLTSEDLKNAIEHHRIRPFYQPKIDCRTRAVVGFEALARWHATDGRIIMPSDFIPLAVSSGLMDDLTKEVSQAGIRWLAESFPGASSVSLALNIVARSLTSTALLESLSEYCRQWSIPPQRIVLELTEGGVVSDEPEVLSELTRVRMMGFQLSIDDFGTGYSSMLELARIPFTELKIDQAFVSTLLTSKESQAVVRTSVDLARNLGLSVVAEGVENDALLTSVTDMHCHYAQGYYIARPMDEVQAVAWARAWSQRC